MEHNWREWFIIVGIDIKLYIRLDNVSRIMFKEDRVSQGGVFMGKFMKEEKSKDGKLPPFLFPFFF